MKKYILLFSCLTGFQLIAQVTTIFHECNNTNAIIIHNETLYIGCAFTGNIYKMMLNETDPTPGLFKAGIVALQDFCVVGEHLYVAQRAIPSELRRVIKLNINMIDPEIEVVHQFSNPYGLTKDDNFLYINDTQEIYKYSLSDINPSPEVIISNTGHNIGGNGMLIMDNHLYITATNQLKKYNLSTFEQSIVYSGANNLKGICIGENEQIIYSVNFTDDYIYKHDLLNQTHTQFVYTQLFSPGEVVYHNNYLYVSNLEGGQVNRINLSTLDVTETATQNIGVFPNPTHGLFTIKTSDISLLGGEITIHNLLGKQIFRTIHSSLETIIDLHGRPQGVYLVRMNHPDKIWTDKIVIH